MRREAMKGILIDIESGDLLLERGDRKSVV